MFDENNFEKINSRLRNEARVFAAGMAALASSLPIAAASSYTPLTMRCAEISAEVGGFTAAIGSLALAVDYYRNRGMYDYTPPDTPPDDLDESKPEVLAEIIEM